MSAPRPRAKGRGAPTILDVAEATGLSKSTVSNVIRGSGQVSAETRLRVLEVVADLGYRPNALARNLVQQRTSTIGVVVGDLSNPFYSELAKLVEQRASTAGFSTMICNTDGHPPSEVKRIESLLEHRVAGIIMLQFSGDAAILDEILAQGVPVTVLSWEERTDCVTVDDEAGAFLAVEHLVDLGHRRIAYLSSGLVEPMTDALRFDGYRRALAGSGLGNDGLLVVRDEEPAYLRSDRDLRTAVARVLADPSPPTAFFVSNDLVAIGLIETLEELGLPVPERISVVGFDDIAVAGLMRVSLTTIAQPREELARLGMEILVSRIEGGGLPLQQIRLEPTLVVRGSSGKLTDTP